MSHSKETNRRYPDNIVVIGGGRWARVLTEVLCDFLPSSICITIYTIHNIVPMLEWISERGLERRIQVLKEWPKFNTATSNAVIIVNAARDHEEAIERALDSGIPVLVEKPVTTSFESSERLVNYANSHNIYFASAHIFLFAKYIENLTKMVSKEGKIQSIKMSWMDPKSENRYGEVKHYDSGLPIFVDLLPHVMSIIGYITSNENQYFKNIEFLRGGAHLVLEFTLDDIPCKVQLVRNGEQRQRVIEIDCDEKAIKLDFSKEPGIISTGSTIINGDQDWKIKERPSEQMLSAFLHGAVTGERDNRLNIDIGLRANQMIDQVFSKYNHEMKNWLTEKLSKVVQMDDDLRYALTEIFQLEGFVSKDILEKQIEQVRQQFTGSKSKKWLTSLSDAQEPLMVLKSIVEQKLNADSSYKYI